ncbi:ciliary microtubule-associated protein 2-like [Lineus longissimus]|uniref:ciliary microtubule-associated protein 2-like n=1 Tax=Lineus longissimus TaxID=88925 RepID=UPI002B4DC3F4
MAEKKYKGAPFGTQTARFDVSAVHPKSKTPGTFTQIPYCRQSMNELNRRLGPGAYDVVNGHTGFNDRAVAERASGPGWARAYEVSRMAALPHLLHKEQWEMKRLLEKKLGPGTYNIKDFLEYADDKPRSKRGICQTKEQRFKGGFESDTPGPGTYGKGGIPHAVMEEKNQKSTGTVGLLDAGSSTPRTLPMVGSDLGPGCYNFESFTEQLNKKVTSLRGPYDLMTGERNKPCITGHYAVPQGQNLGAGQYELKSFLDDWGSEHKKKHGKFGKVAQYPEKNSDRIYCCTLSQLKRDVEDPGPGHFDPKYPNEGKPAAKKSPGFGSSAQRNDRMAQKFFTRNFNPVGPGRYDIQKWEDAQHINSHTSVFRSKTGKPNQHYEKFLKERIRAKDVRPEDKVFLVEQDQPSAFIQRAKGAEVLFQAQKAATMA